MKQSLTDKQTSNIHLQLFISFIKMGFFMFGGGYAMIPLLEKELIERRKWIDNDDLVEIISFSQMTPGTIAINAATHIGNTKGKVLGGIVASLGVIFPSLLVITIIFYTAGDHFDTPYIQNAFIGIRACLVAMICKSVYLMIRSANGKAIFYAILLLSVTGLMFGLNPIMIIIIGGALGILIWGNLFNNHKKSS
ncbi:chromate transporter [Robertkochia solimangrovi]|uniref:chromate transporter n=1 Tax=Robertkochia solimangrovi TaxID=2213046 RepID=UPI0011803529|nr:chromate transporter [Robertkochia solimangrovi]TRZ41583.1 chromate transporter [Robertkochia solimangrovi]